MEIDLGIAYTALNVKDIHVAYAFYKNLGFEPVPEGGSLEEKWLILRNGQVKVGLFQGMFPRNLTTINPPNARKIYHKLKAGNTKFLFVSKNIDDLQGKCSFMVADPDGNPLLFDQLND